MIRVLVMEKQKSSQYTFLIQILYLFSASLATIPSSLLSFSPDVSIILRLVYQRLIPNISWGGGVLHTIILKKKNSYSRNLLVPFLSFLLRNWLQDLKGPKSNASDVCWKNMESGLHSLNKINGTHLLRLAKDRR